MLPFFRKIRYRLAQDNKFLQYSRYAIGEIILVVIGILIALQINNWNEQQKDLKTENQILNNLHQEFVTNTHLANEIIKINNNVTASCISLMNLSLKGYDGTINADSLLYHALEGRPFLPSNNIYTEIINTGKIELIRGEKVKNLLFEYNRMLDNNKSTYALFEKWLEEQILPYLANHIALRNIDQYGTMAWEERSKFNHDLTTILNDRTFENLIDNNIYHLSRLNDEYLNLKRISQELVNITRGND